MSTYKKILSNWAKQWKKDNLSEDIQKLISQANFDLYYGPINDGAVGDPAEEDEELKKYPGFSSAVSLIKEAIEDVPSCIYVDTDTEEVRYNEPEPEKCESCNGQGTNSDNEECHDCGGLGCFEPFGNWWIVERSQILSELVGSELKQYL